MRTLTAEQEVPKQKTPFQKVTFGSLTQDSFLKDVQDRVDQYFQSNNISKNANTQMVIKTVLILSGYVGTYLLIISNLISPWGMFILALIHGFLTAMIGLNIGHDSIHGSYTSNPRLNKILGLTFNMIGANDYVWSISHNIVHHTYTNIPHHDGDIHQLPILRMEPTQKLWWVHRFQYIYAYMFYCLASISWVFVKDYVKFFQHQLGGYYRKTFPRKEIVRLFVYKAIYYTLFLAVPLIVIDLAWYWIVLGIVAAHFVQGLTMAIVFMLAHIIEGTSFPEPGPDGKIDMAWADLQMYTTSNFAINNPVVNYLCGGLNFQIEHHLFPKVCHIHYSKISRIVRQTAKDHKLPYLEQKTFFGAIASHTRLLKKFGAPSVN
ncbi:MAG: acyl-CoA desaturase [Bacteroidetes bacterium]|nr:acyl-CoA desaturase [Bacteroidota bacterium]MDA1122316.1 acyl-CoA desaturase [Bacteroidota bacterium]